MPRVQTRLDSRTGFVNAISPHLVWRSSRATPCARYLAPRTSHPPCVTFSPRRKIGVGGGFLFDFSDRQTVLIWDTNPHTPRLYFKPAPPLHLPRHNDLLGLHRLITGMEMYYASPAESRLPVAPLVKCGGSWCLDVYH